MDSSKNEEIWKSLDADIEELLKIENVHTVSMGHRQLCQKPNEQTPLLVHVHRIHWNFLRFGLKRIPSRIKGLKVKVVVKKELQFNAKTPSTATTWNNKTYRPLQPGAKISSHSPTFADDGTLGAFVTKTSNTYLLTCGHVLVDVANHVYQPDESPGAEQFVIPATGGLKVGTGLQRIDAGIALIPNTVGTSNKVIGFDGSGIEGARVKFSNNTPFKVRLSGARSGVQVGTVTSIDYSSTSTGWAFQGFIEVEFPKNAVTNGDSGSSVLDAQNRLIGIFFGSEQDQLNTFGIVVPINKIMAPSGQGGLNVALKSDPPGPKLFLFFGGSPTNLLYQGPLTWLKILLSKIPLRLHVSKLEYMVHASENDWWDNSSIVPKTIAPTSVTTDSSNYIRLNSSIHPASIVFDGKLFVLYSDNSSNLRWSQYNKNGEFDVKDEIVSTSDGNSMISGDPALVIYNNTLYCFRRGHGNSIFIWFVKYTTAKGWHEDRNSNMGISGSPSAIVYGGSLYVVRRASKFKKLKKARVWIGKLLSGNSWDDQPSKFRSQTNPELYASSKFGLMCVYGSSYKDSIVNYPAYTLHIEPVNSSWTIKDGNPWHTLHIKSMSKVCIVSYLGKMLFIYREYPTLNMNVAELDETGPVPILKNDTTKYKSILSGGVAGVVF
jgi:hypothetical protein